MRTILTTLHSKYIHPSLALPYLAAFCAEGCGELRIREFTVHEPKENVLAALLCEEPDVIAFSVYLWNRRETLELADALAVARPGIRVVLGGPEVSFDSSQLFEQHKSVTALVRGEGEIPLRGLLHAWDESRDPDGIPRLVWRKGDEIVEGPDAPPLIDLDAIPSPFEGGLVDLDRGFVYYETSRGCPFECAFCMSALDRSVRSFSIQRIEEDLLFLMEHGVKSVKLVDRTFNYDAARAREIWSFILQHNRSTHFHFEIGAHLLDEASLALLETVPRGVFQFEIGVQSTLPGTLRAIGRRADLDSLETAIARLRRNGTIHLHLDLIAGLPGENFKDFLTSIDRVAAMRPHHLQIEPVKLLPGSPLRNDAERLGIRFDPAPPYNVLGTPDLTFAEIERLRGISRLFDLTCNSGRFDTYLDGLQQLSGSLSAGLARMEAWWRAQGLFRHPLSQRALFDGVWDFICASFGGSDRENLRERLANDFALSERVVPNNHPLFFDTHLSDDEARQVKDRVRQETDNMRGQGIKIQHFAALFENLADISGRTVILYLYLTRTGGGMDVRRIPLT